MNFVLRAVPTLFVLNVSFLLAMVFVHNLDQENIIQSIDSGFSTGTLSSENYPFGPFGKRLDMWTECIALSSAALPYGTQSTLRRAIEHPYILSGPDGRHDTCGALAAYIKHRANIQKDTYTRYWHGYDIYLRPVLRLGVSIENLHRLNLIVVVVMSLSLVWISTLLLPSMVPLIVLCTLLVTTDIASVPVTTTHMLGLFVALGTGLAIAGYLRFQPTSMEGVKWISLYSGAMFAFVDLLVNPPLVPTLIIFFIISVEFWRKRDTEVEYRRLFIVSLVAMVVWFLSYAVTWSMKWLIAAVEIGPQVVIDEVFPQIKRRLIGEVRSEFGGSVALDFGTATLKNLRELGWKFIGIAVVIVILTLTDSAIRYRRMKQSVCEFIILCSPAIIPFVWIETLRNHSVIHSWFVYRSAGLSLGIVIASAVLVRLRSMELSRGDGLETANQ